MNNISRSYHVSYNRQLICYGLCSQLSLANHSGQESSYFKHPPLQTKHEHAGDGQFYKGAPLLQTVQWPTCGSEVCALSFRLGSNYLLWEWEDIFWCEIYTWLKPSIWVYHLKSLKYCRCVWEVGFKYDRAHFHSVYNRDVTIVNFAVSENVLLPLWTCDGITRQVSWAKNVVLFQLQWSRAEGTGNYKNRQLLRWFLHHALRMQNNLNHRLELFLTRQKQAAVKDTARTKRSLKLQCWVKLTRVNEINKQPAGVYFCFLFSGSAQLCKERKTKLRSKRPADLCVKNSSSQQTNTLSQLGEEEGKLMTHGMAKKTLQVENCCLQVEFMKSNTGKARHSSGNRIRTVLLGNSNMDAKRLLILLMAFCVEILNFYFVLKSLVEEQETRGENLCPDQQLVDTSFRSNMCSAISENVSKHVTTRELGAFW